MKAGDHLPTIKKTISQEVINRYAEAVGDVNPIHIDPLFAQNTPFGGTVAHGMLILAYVWEVLILAFGKSCFQTSTFSARFKAPLRSGDTLIVSGAVKSREEEREHVVYTCNLKCTNGKEEVLIGETTVRVAK